MAKRTRELWPLWQATQQNPRVDSSGPALFIPVWIRSHF